MDIPTYISTGFSRTGLRDTGKRLAAACGISPSYLSQIARDEAKRTPKLCVLIERHTNGLVTRQELRSDWAEIWPELVKRAPRVKRVS